jgi:Cu/Ag efflux protein CusF
MSLKFLKNVPYFLAASLFVVALSLAACTENGLGGGGEDLPGLTQEPFPEVTDEPSPDVPDVEETEEPSPEVTEESPEAGEMPQTGTIDSIDLEASRITLMLDTGETMDVNVDEFLTLVTINGAAGTLQDLQPGDTVEVEMDQATGTAASISVGS